jgi:hypothetical protein
MNSHRPVRSVGLGCLLALAVLLVVSVRSAHADSSRPSITSISVDNPVVGLPATLHYNVSGATTVACRWQKNGNDSSGPLSTWSDVAGATSCNSYTPVTGDDGYWLRSKLTATNSAGSTIGYSRPYRVGGEVIGDVGCGGMYKVVPGGVRYAISAGPSPPPCPNAPDVSPDGRLVAYQSDSAGQSDIYLTDSRGAWKR